MAENDTSLEDQVLANAAGPKSAEVDGQKVEQHSLKDQLELYRMLESRKAMRGKSCGIRFAKMIPGGAD